MESTGNRITMAMSLPEIITNVLSFLDPPSLQACIQVSRLWHACGHPLSWQRRSITTAQLKLPLDDKMQDFFKNSHHIRSLEVTVPRATLEDPSEILPEDLPDVQFPNLTRLVHKINPPRKGIQRSNVVSHHVEKILEQCTELQDLECEMNNIVVPMLFVKSILNHTTSKLKRLSISGSFSAHQLRIFQYLIEAHSAYQQHQLEALKDISITNSVEATAGSTSGCGQLEELVLRNHLWHISRQLDSRGFRHIPGTLPIRSLTFVGFKTEINYYRNVNQVGPVQYASMEQEQFFQQDHIMSYFEYQADSDYVKQEDDAALAVIEKCPRLEKFRVTFDLSSILDDTCRHGFQDALTDRFQSFKLKDARPDFVQVMVSSCPNLRDIELGMMHHLTSQQWNEMTRAYGQQLESFSVWGNHGRFEDTAFMNLIGPPLAHPSRNRPHCLTRLNINGLDRLQDCAWVALQQLPHLKEFRARGVPLDAKRLVTKDGWVCKGLEVLEIFIAVYKRPDSWTSEWHWCEVEGRWVMGGSCSSCGETQSPKQEPTQAELVGSVRREDQDNENGTTEETEGGADQYSKELQVKVCEMLGRLTRLRVLRIEGDRTATRDCLDLTLETGLDRLAPLRQNLQKLVVTQLDEWMAGKKEVEWITRNWIHHQNRQWSEKQDLMSGSSLPWLEPFQGSVGHEDFTVSNPKFMELVGITASNGEPMQNIGWLKEQCPSLHVHVAHE